MSVSTAVDIANIALQRLGQPTISTLTEMSRDASICNQLYDQNRDYCMMLIDWDCLINRQMLTRAGKVSITGASQANPVVVSCTGHLFIANEIVYIESVAGMTQLNEVSFRVYSYTSQTITLYDLDGKSLDGTGYTAWTSGGYVYRDPSYDWTYIYDLPTDCLKVLDVIDEYGKRFDLNGDKYEWSKERTFVYTDIENAGVRYIKKDTDPSKYESDLIEIIAARLAWYVSMRIHSDKELRNEVYNEFAQAVVRARVTNAQGAQSEEPAEDPWVDAR